jgi:P4 family phage/plasmid primase-like protien
MAAGRYDIEAIRRAANGRWADVLVALGGISRDRLSGAHGPCPKCGGKDRFRAHKDFPQTGGVLCNQCFSSRNGDGFAAIQWLCDISFPDALHKIAEFVGVAANNGKAFRSIDPAKDLEPRQWNATLVAIWCQKKQGITPAAIQAAGGILARYREQFTVIALPVWGPKFKQAKPVGWCLFAANGGKLPRKLLDGKVEWVKVKLTFGSQPGVIGVVRDGGAAWKTEGPTDALALLSLPDLPADVSVFCNAFGAKEDPAKTPWIAELFKGRRGYVIHDCDVPGQEGATEVPRSNGPSRPGWAPAIAAHASECRNVLLPYEIQKDHGKDLRDWLYEGHSYQDLLKLADASAIVQPIIPDDSLKPVEAEDDPHRLARMNLEQYASQRGGRTIRYWRDEWYVWRETNYRRITEKELRAKITQACKQEFDRIYLEKKATGSTKEEEVATRRVTTSLVTNVLQATAGMTVLSSSVEPMTWLPTRERKNYVAMKNGILDMDAVIADRDDYLIPHTPDWFSTICLPYAFDANATCPRWERFLERNLEMDPERIKLLQEWAGYLLLPDTGQQKFLVLEGEGANGKSVFCAAIEAMLGSQNVSHVPLEVFGEKFELTSTLDRLANICGDAGELDKVAEGHIKAFTAGNPMTFGRKYLDSVERVPTARLMMAVNNRPRFSDRSDGVWRRMLLVPWRIQIPAEERVPNMDKPWWWERSGELPGILLWAIKGLHRLQTQGKFTTSEVCEEALADYRSEMNPARTFLKDHIEESQTSKIRSAVLYEFYVKWSKQSGYHPLSERQFGKEVARVFRKCKRVKLGSRAERFYCYDGICFLCDEICGEKIDGGLFF